MRTILISAYACEPFKGSEQGVGWNYVLQLAKHNNVHVITRSNNEELIVANIPQYLSKTLTFHYYDNQFIKKFKNSERGLYFYYLCWQIGVYSLARSLSLNIKFDYCIHLTFGNIWLPTFLFYLNIPFILGPTGGGERIPSSFIKVLSLQQQFLQILRYFLRYSIYINVFFILTAIKSRALLCRTNETAKIFPVLLKDKISIVSDGAIEPDIFEFRAKYSDKKNIKIISTSKLIGYKNVICIIQSLKYIPTSYNIECVIIGDGPDKCKIQKKEKELNIKHKVQYLNKLSRNEVLENLTNADVFISPSLRDACNLSLLESMAVGLPVICLNWSGMAMSTDDKCAIRLPVTNPEQMPKDMADAIIKLANNPQLRKSMGEAGRERIRKEFNWDAKGEFMEKLFDSLENKKKA